MLLNNYQYNCNFIKSFLRVVDYDLEHATLSTSIQGFYNQRSDIHKNDITHAICNTSICLPDLKGGLIGAIYLKGSRTSIGYYTSMTSVNTIKYLCNEITVRDVYLTYLACLAFPVQFTRGIGLLPMDALC